MKKTNYSVFPFFWLRRAKGSVFSVVPFKSFKSLILLPSPFGEGSGVRLFLPSGELKGSIGWEGALVIVRGRTKAPVTECEAGLSVPCFCSDTEHDWNRASISLDVRDTHLIDSWTTIGIVIACLTITTHFANVSSIIAFWITV